MIPRAFSSIRVRRTSLGAMLLFYGFAGTGQPQLTYQYPLARIAGEFIAGCLLFRIYEWRMGGARPNA